MLFLISKTRRVQHNCQILVLAAVKLEDTHRIPDPSIELSPVQIQEGPFFEPWKRLLSYPLSRLFIASSLATTCWDRDPVREYATPKTSVAYQKVQRQETLAAGIDTTPSASSTQYVTPATETPSANNTQQEMLHPAAEAFAPDETTPDTSADNGFTEIGETLIGTVRPAPEDVVIMQETMTKREHSELEEVSNPWSKRLRTRKYSFIHLTAYSDTLYSNTREVDTGIEPLPYA
ncbi:hypothetical protein JB92DRAFT_2829886 [Gautieria morchelliformis]|nr:hypothetical protein JB92DRAFT_2829886 [Gautieria morchelliformis]